MQNLNLVGWCDANWVGDVDTHKSMIGYVFMLVKGTISKKSKWQPIITLSSIEAKYMAKQHKL